MRDTLRADPRQRSVAAVVYVHDDLMRKGRVLTNAAYAQLQQRKIVPGGDDYGKHFDDSSCGFVPGLPELLAARCRDKLAAHQNFRRLMVDQRASG